MRINNTENAKSENVKCKCDEQKKISIKAVTALVSFQRWSEEFLLFAENVGLKKLDKTCRGKVYIYGRNTIIIEPKYRGT